MRIGVTPFDARSVVVSLMAFGTMPVQADVLFDNFGPDDTFNTGAGRSFGETLETGNHFSVTGGDFFLDSIELPVGSSFGQNLLRLDFFCPRCIPESLSYVMFLNSLTP